MPSKAFSTNATSDLAERLEKLKTLVATAAGPPSDEELIDFGKYKRQPMATAWGDLNYISWCSKHLDRTQHKRFFEYMELKTAAAEKGEGPMPGETSAAAASAAAGPMPGESAAAAPAAPGESVVAASAAPALDLETQYIELTQRVDQLSAVVGEILKVLVVEMPCS